MEVEIVSYECGRHEPKDPLMRWLESTPNASFEQLHRRLMRLSEVPEVTVLHRGKAQVQWEEANVLRLTGLQDK